MGVCNQVAFLIIYYITSRPLPILKVTDAPLQVPNILDIIVSFKFLNFSSQICLLFVREMSANFTPYLVQIIYIALAWILCPLNFSPLPVIQKPKHSSLNQGFFCLNSFKPRLSLLYYILYTTLLCYIILCCVLFCCAVLFILNYVVLYYIILYYITLYYVRNIYRSSFKITVIFVKF